MMEQLRGGIEKCNELLVELGVARPARLLACRRLRPCAGPPAGYRVTPLFSLRWARREVACGTGRREHIMHHQTHIIPQEAGTRVDGPRG